MKKRIFVTLKPGVLDPQGRAVHHALDGLGYAGVNDVRIGRLIAEMCEKLLANMVIENYRIEDAG